MIVSQSLHPDLAGNALSSGIRSRLAEAEPQLLAFRRDVHAHPELAWTETRTTGAIAAALDRAGIRNRKLAGSGVIADIGAEDAVRRVALRADIDALPLEDRTGLPFASIVPGIAHACGHDVHTTVVLGAGVALKAVEDELIARGRAVRLLFQPAEERVPGGAHHMVEAGGLEGVDEIFAVHCDPSIDVGEIGLATGPITSACDALTVTLRGKGGHTSRPQLTQDLVYALSKVVTDVPAALSRRLDPRAGAALVWGSVNAGNAQNVIPAVGTCSGTLRVLDAEVWRDLQALVEQIVHEVAAPYAVQVEIDYSRGVPPVVNGAEPIQALTRAAVSGIGPQAPVSTLQSLGGEDFSWYLDHVPGAMARLGTRTPGGHTYELHQGDLVVDERAVLIGASLLAGAAVFDRSDASGQTGA
ncbi:amidohydrolase [Dermacoccaceae bacterium W4C1]